MGRAEEDQEDHFSKEYGDDLLSEDHAKNPSSKEHTTTFIGAGSRGPALWQTFEDLRVEDSIIETTHRSQRTSVKTKIHTKRCDDNLFSEDYNENLFSKDYAKNLFSEEDNGQQTGVNH